MVEKISVQIALDGGDEVAKQLAAIGDAASKAFADVKAGDAAAEIEKVGEASTTTSGQLAKVKELSDQAAQSFNQVAQEALKTATAVAELTGTIAEHAVKIGLAVQSHRGWISSLISMGSAAGTAARGLSLLAPELAAMATGVGVLVVAAGALVAALAAVNSAAAGVVAPFSKISEDLEKLSKNTGQTFDSLQRGKAVFEQLGISGEGFAAIITKIKGAMDSLDIGAKFKEQAKEGLLALKELLEAQLALERLGGRSAPPDAARQLGDVNKELEQGTSEREKAEERLAEAIVRNATLAANSLRTLIPLVEAIAAGQQNINFDPLTTAAAKIDALVAAMKQAEGEGKSAAEVLNRFIANADRLSAIQVGAKFGISEDQVDNIRLIRDSVTEIWDRAKSAPPLISPEARKNLEELTKATAALRQEQARLQQAWDSSIFARFGAGYLTVIAGLKTAFVRWASDFIETGNSFPARFAAWFNRLPAAVDAAIAMARSLWNGFVASLPDISWDGITSGAAAAWEWVKQKVAEAKQAILDFGAALPGIAWDAITAGADAAWAAIKQGAAEAKQAILDFGAALPGIAWDVAMAGIQSIIDKVKELLRLRPTGGGAGPAPAPGLARGGFIGGRGTGTSDSNLAWLSRGEYIMPAGAVRQPGVLSFLEALRRSGRIPGFAAGGIVGGGGTESINVPVDQMLRALERNTEAVDSQSTVIIELGRMINEMGQSIGRLIQEVAALGQQQGELVRTIGALLDKAAGRARGGLLGGRGTGTSDSNLAWVSRGEHIMPAHAVRQPGVLAFLELLRRSGGNLADVLDGMGRFALGGLVPRVMPSFATGGLAGGMSNVTIQFPGLPAIGGLRASSGVVDELRKAAAMAQVRSGGRKPSRYS